MSLVEPDDRAKVTITIQDVKIALGKRTVLDALKLLRIEAGLQDSFEKQLQDGHSLSEGHKTYFHSQFQDLVLFEDFDVDRFFTLLKLLAVK